MIPDPYILVSLDRGKKLRYKGKYENQAEQGTNKKKSTRRQTKSCETECKNSPEQDEKVAALNIFLRSF